MRERAARRAAPCRIAVAALVAIALVTATRAHASRFAPSVVINATTLGGLEFRDIACPSPRQCTAVSSKGDVVTFDPVSTRIVASAALRTDPEAFSDLACPATGECTLLDASENEFSIQPTNPQALSPRSIHASAARNAGIRSLSCPSVAQCTAVGTASDAVTFDPQSPSLALRLTAMPANENLLDVSCPTTTQCTAVGEATEVTFSPVAPLSAVRVVIDPDIEYSDKHPAYLVSISCPSAGQCTALDETGGEVTFDPVRPAGPTLGKLSNRCFQGRCGVACPAVSQCTAAVNDSLLTFDPLSPTAPTALNWPPPDKGLLTGLACPLTTQCTVVSDGIWGHGGEALTFNPNPTAPAALTRKPWTQRQCRRAYRQWSRHHPHAKRSQRRREALRLRRQHGCSSSL